SVHFFKGKIIKLISSSKKSFLGELLVEHGLSLKTDIENLLEKKDPDKKMGELLIEKELLSPHMLSFILKEQIKIRLSEFMSQSVVRVSIKEKKEKDIVSDMEIDFSDLDFIEWLADSIQTELKEDFLKSFYFQIQDCLIHKNSQLNIASVCQKEYLDKYNSFFKSLEEGAVVQKVIEASKFNPLTLRLFYFGLLTKSIYLKDGNTKQKGYGQIESFLESILNKKFDNVFEFFGLSETASMDEIDSKYRKMVKMFHPDSLPNDISLSLKNKAEQALSIIGKNYKLIKNESKKGDYLKSKNQDQFLAVINKYEKGILKIKEGDYKTAYTIFLDIKDHKQAPINTILYFLWAQMKRTDVNLFQDRLKAVKIQKEIDSCSISLRTSYLFWFVKGLFCFQTEQYDRANELFDKTLIIKKDFAPAKRELMSLRKKLREIKKSSKSFFSFLKRSS
ncbi:MAG: J domain-containing protein, partial [Bdellovibrionaceae bacterium]|nr:J domain-containing protein [Pseudobdellovibrionaceae bacterium]